MLPSGAVHTDYSIKCYECENLLRAIDGKDIAEIHTNSDGEDVCWACCDICDDENSWDNGEHIAWSGGDQTPAPWEEEG